MQIKYSFSRRRMGTYLDTAEIWPFDIFEKGDVEVLRDIRETGDFVGT